MFCRFAAVRCLAIVLFVGSLPLASAQEAPDIAKHERWVTSLAFSNDGTLLASVGGESLQYRPGDVKLWDVKSGKLVASLEGHPSNVWAVAFSPDGKTLVTTGYDGKVLVWDTAEKKAVATLEKHKGWCRAVAYHPSGTHFATGGEDGSVVVWDRASLKEAKEFKAHDSAVYALAFSPQDGNTLASGSTDKTAKLWDWQNAKETKKLEGHTDAVWAVAYARDGSRLATAGADRKIKLWSAAGEDQGVLEGHKDWITDLAFSTDAAILASSDYGRNVKVWNVNDKKEAEQPERLQEQHLERRLFARRKNISHRLPQRFHSPVAAGDAMAGSISPRRKERSC